MRPATSGTQVCEALGLEPGAPVHEVAIRYQRNGEPLALRTLSVPVAAMPDLPDQLGTNSIATVMASLGLAGGAALQTFRATRCTRAQAELLGISPGDAVMVWSGVLYTAEAAARAHVLTLFRGDRITFQIRQGRPVVAAVGTTSAAP